MAEENKFKLKIITPERTFYEDEVTMVEFNTVEGEVGIYKGHIPMAMVVAPGIITITQEDESKNAALHAGFVEVLPDEVTILAEIIEWPIEIDLDRAEAAKGRAEGRLQELPEGTDVARAEVALRKAIARINVVKM